MSASRGTRDIQNWARYTADPVPRVREPAGVPTILNPDCPAQQVADCNVTWLLGKPGASVIGEGAPALEPGVDAPTPLGFEADRGAGGAAKTTEKG